MYANRTEAGLRLAHELRNLEGEEVVVLGLPRGGVPVAYQVAKALGAPLDVILVRKLGLPFQPELAIGAIGEDGIQVINEDVIRLTGTTDDEVAAVEDREQVELKRRARRYRANRDRIPLAGRTVVVVDDGIATGSTAKAACRVARLAGARRVILAVPVAPPDWTNRFGHVADELIAVATPEPFHAIGQFYRDFTQTSDEEVVACLDRVVPSKDTVPANPGNPGDEPPFQVEEVTVHTGSALLGGHLTVPENTIGVVVFAHGAGSSRHSPRNRFVAAELNRAGFATLLFDLLTEAEEVYRANVFDIDLLGRRLVEVTAWVHRQTELVGLPVGYFGASTGAAAALWAAADADAEVAAVVSRGGRPDLTGSRLGEVRAPSLLIVGGQDDVVLALNERARARMKTTASLAVIPGATHLFEEPGTLRAAADRARDWFLAYLGSDAQVPS